MTFDPSRVPVKRNLPGTANAYLKTGDFVDLRETLAYLLREMAEPFGSHSADHYRKLADKIAAASGEHGSGAAPPRRATPAASLKPEIGEAIRWLHRVGHTERDASAASLIAHLAHELDEARAALRWAAHCTSGEWPVEYGPAFRAAREAADGK